MKRTRSAAQSNKMLNDLLLIDLHKHASVSFSGCGDRRSARGCWRWGTSNKEALAGQGIER